MVELNVDNEIATLLRMADQRYTKGRRRLVAALQCGNGPLTITQILALDPALPQSSVYRNLAILEEVNAVTRIVTRHDFARYELAENLTEHHHHLICDECGDVIDFAASAGLERSLSRGLETVARATGFQPRSHALEILGRCARCASDG